MSNCLSAMMMPSEKASVGALFDWLASASPVPPLLGDHSGCGEWDDNRRVEPDAGDHSSEAGVIHHDRARITFRYDRWLPLMARKVLYGAALAATSGCGALAFETLATAQIVDAPPMPRPDYLQPATDPVFGTRFIRVTEPGRHLGAGIFCGQAYCRHR